MLVCCGCGLFVKQEFTCNVDEVKKIEIVTFDGYKKNEPGFKYTVLTEISDHSYFVDRLKAIKTSVNWGDPQMFEKGYTVIRIEYLNGDYDLIHCNAQFKKRDDKTNSGYLFFDVMQYNALISKYVPEE